MKSILSLFLLAAGFGAQAQTYIDQYQTIIPHVVHGAGWRNRFVIGNYNSIQMTVQLRFFGNDGTAMSLPIKNHGVSSVLTVQVPAYDSLVLETQEPAGSVLYEGYATAEFVCLVGTCADVAVYGVFSTVETPGYPVFEASVLAGDSRSTQAVIPFDNRDGFITGIAVAAHTCTGSTHDFQLRALGGSIVVPADLSGKVITTVPTYSFKMSCPGHKSLSLPDVVSATKGKKGVIIVEDGNSNAQLSAVGILFNPKGGAHTTIPAAEKVPIVLF